MSSNRFASLTTGDDDDQPVVESNKPAKQPKAKAADKAPASKFPGDQPAAKDNKERGAGGRGGGRGGATRGRGRGGSRGGGAGGGGKREFDRQSGTGRKEGRSAQKNGYGGWGDDKGADDLAGQTKPEPTPSPAPDNESKEAETAAAAEALAAELAAEEEEKKLRLFADVQAEKERKRAEVDANREIRQANNNTFKGAAGKELVRDEDVDPLFALGAKKEAPAKAKEAKDKPKVLSVVEFSGHVPVQPKQQPRVEGDRPRGKGKGGRGGKGAGKGKGGKGSGKGKGKGGNNTKPQVSSGPGYKVEGADFPALPLAAKN